MLEFVADSFLLRTFVLNIKFSSSMLKTADGRTGLFSMAVPNTKLISDSQHKNCYMFYKPKWREK
jgi:hypothetical protein